MTLIQIAVPAILIACFYLFIRFTKGGKKKSNYVPTGTVPFSDPEMHAAYSRIVNYIEWYPVRDSNAVCFGWNVSERVQQFRKDWYRKDRAYSSFLIGRIIDKALDKEREIIAANQHQPNPMPQSYSSIFIHNN